MAGYGGSTEQMFQEIQKPMFNSGILQMDHVDGSQMAATFTEMLCQSGSYMSFLYYTCDGRYFYNASKAATIAATCEPLFRNLLHTKHPSLTVDAATGKIRGDAITLREGDKTAVILINRSSLPTAFTLKTKDIEHLDGIQLSSKKLISQKKGIYTVTVAPFSPMLYYSVLPRKIRAHQKFHKSPHHLENQTILFFVGRLIRQNWNHLKSALPQHKPN